MSAGKGEYPGEPPITIISDLDVLAPKFRAVVIASLDECHASELDAIVHESQRTNETQAVYYARGRTTVPPHRTVTNARTNRYSWHGYGLAVDVISKSKGWDAGDEWFERVAAIFDRNGCTSGIHWRVPDPPHHQWGRCRDTPSDHARELLASGGVVAVWREVNAL